MAAAQEASLVESPTSPRVSKRASNTAASSTQPKKRQKKTAAFEEDFGEKSPSPEAAKTAPKARASRAPPKNQRKKAATPEQQLSEDAESTPVVTNGSKREMQSKSYTVRERDQDGDGEAVNASRDDIEVDVATGSGSGSDGSAAEYKRMERKSKLTSKKADDLRASKTTGRATVNADNERLETSSGRVVDSGSEMSALLDTKPKPNQKRTSSGKVLSKKSYASKAGGIKEQSTETNAESNNQLKTGKGAESESEMSVVLDEPPKRKKRDTASEKTAAKNPGTLKAGKRPEPPAEPDAEEIKRLQGWLVKCGVRKLWGKELAPYDTPKLKIRHLRALLSQIGMTGRFSAEKAKQIREERELRADLEEVQQGAKLWGREETGEVSSVKPRRRLARGFTELDFLNSDEGAETD